MCVYKMESEYKSKQMRNHICDKLPRSAMKVTRILLIGRQTSKRERNVKGI